MQYLPFHPFHHWIESYISQQFLAQALVSYENIFLPYKDISKYKLKEKSLINWWISKSAMVEWDLSKCIHLPWSSNNLNIHCKKSCADLRFVTYQCIASIASLKSRINIQTRKNNLLVSNYTIPTWQNFHLFIVPTNNPPHLVLKLPQIQNIILAYLSKSVSFAPGFSGLHKSLILMQNEIYRKAYLLFNLSIQEGHIFSIGLLFLPSMPFFQ